MQQLNQQDAMFLYSETPRMPMHLSSIHLYDPSTAPEQITFDRLMEQVRSRLPLARILRRKLVHVPLDLDYPYWVEDEDFDLEFHVRNIALPLPAAGGSSGSRQRGCTRNRSISPGLHGSSTSSTVSKRHPAWARTASP